MAKLEVPLKIIWGEKDIYIKKEMGEEFAQRNKVPLAILPNMGHYPHLQAPRQTADEIRAHSP